jgi:predicted RNA-binding Zn-ribbon protein involved in translation (DUF1610 family)
MPFIDYKRPSMIVLRPGTYTYQCPACGHVTIFTVKGQTV